MNNIHLNYRTVFQITSTKVVKIISIFALLFIFTSSAKAQTFGVYLYVNSSPQNITYCTGSGVLDYSTYLAAQDWDGLEFYYRNFLTWTLQRHPAHGIAVGSFSGAYTSGIMIPSGPFTYTPNSGYIGLDTFSVGLVDTSGNVDSTIIVVNITTTPSVISGNNTLCDTSSTTLTDSIPNGTWTVDSTSFATIDNMLGVLTGVSGGTVHVTYTTGCGTDAYKTVFIATNAGVINGSSNLCTGTSITLTDTISGGIWTSDLPGVAYISSPGVVTGLTAGANIITYSIGCGPDAYKILNIVQTPSTVAAITGRDTVCVSSTATLSETSTGGSWTSSNTLIATVDSTGLVTGVATGNTTINYTISNICGTATNSVNVAVQTVPSISSISGLGNVCQTATITMTDATPGGTWISHTTGIATISGTGIVTGVNSGIDTIGYSLTNTCGTTESIKIITINPSPVAGTISGTTLICVGSNTTLSDVVPGGTWTSSNTSVATITSGGIITAVGTGTTTISYTVTNTCGTLAAITIVTVNPILTVSVITGLSALCAGLTTTLADSVSGGSWNSTVPGVATISTGGVVTAIGAGTTTISYSNTNSCGTTTATKSFTVNPQPVAGTISGTTTLCATTSTTLTDAAPSGTWSSSSTTVGTITSGGVFNALAQGTTLISYTVTNICGTVEATIPITVNPLPTVSVITGLSTLCAGLTTTLADSVSGGSWNSTVPAVATISTGGVVTAVSAGTTTISYSNTNSCGTTTATKSFTVNPQPIAGTISGTTTLCATTSTTLTDAAPSGTWSSSNTAVGTISSGGVFNALAQGTTLISYTVTNICGTVATTIPITVNPLPTVSVITGLSTLCAGLTTTLADSVSGGSWNSTVPGAATISTSGVVTAIGAGTTTISYSNTNSCGTATATKSFTVNPQPIAGTISGTTTLCATTSTTLTDAASGGTWSSSNTAVGTISSGGVFNALAQGTTLISYTVTNICGTVAATTIVTVNPQPVAGTISGVSSVCATSTTTLTDIAPGGVWSSVNTGVATVSGGVVTGVSAGTSVISYTVTNICGTAVATTTVTVNPQPISGTISGSASICFGTTATLSDVAAGGVWSSNNTGVATISGGGGITTISAGVATISYTVTNGCGTSVATYAITINPLPNAGTITGVDSVCVLSTTTLSDTRTGGIWSSSNTAIASINSTGVVTGVSSGNLVISYSVTTPCGTADTTFPFIVKPLPNAGIITGPSTVCIGSIVTLSDSVAGGTWTKSNSNANISGGVVSGVTAGPETITYTISGFCGSISTTFPMSINPYSGTITGPVNVCVGSSISLTDLIPGGIWASSNTSASVTGGLVSGLAGGSDTISYSVTTTCGTSISYHYIVINPLPNSGSIIGPNAVCIGSTITLSETGSIGIWSISNPNALISGGHVTGMSVGTDTVSYTVSNSCGSSSAILPITILPILNAGIISGATSLCEGATITLTDTALGGTWMTSNTNASVVAGAVTGNTQGMDSVYYIVSNICGTDTAKQYITINPLPIAGTISGPTSVCAGNTITLADAGTAGGSWISLHASIATMASDNVTGVSAGADTILYVYSNLCGADTAHYAITVNPLPNAGTITGPTNVCVGSGITLADPATGGNWSVNDTNATVTGGIVTGISAGTAIISYTDSNICGSTTVEYTITINPLPYAGIISGPTTVCALSTITLTDGVSGGTWSSTNSSASVTSGIVTGNSQGIDTIRYSLTTICGTNVANYIVSINPSPNAGTIMGLTFVCPNATITLTDSISGGIWHSSNADATVLAGVVTGITPGTDTITYKVTNSCGSAIAVHTISIGTLPYAGVITGSDSVCKGNTLTLSDATTGGIWSATNSNASVAGGVVTSISGGIDTIIYSVTNACGTANASFPVYIETAPVAEITGLTFACVGRSDTLSSSPGGGSWSSTNIAKATVTGSIFGGIVTGVSAGIDTIVYHVTNQCGSSTVKFGIIVFAANQCPLDVTNVNAVNGLDLKIYPNPSDGHFTLEAPQTNSTLSILVSDIYGNIVLRTENSTNKTSINLGKMASGTYIVRVIAGDEIYREKIVIW